MRKKSLDRDWETFPREYNGIQVNTCKSFHCVNFGISPYSDIEDGDQSKKVAKHHPRYTTSGNGKNEAAIICKECRKSKAIIENIQASWMLKSNEAVFQEFHRHWKYLDKTVTCPNENCVSHTTSTHSIKKRGLTKKGTQRYHCKLCNRSFTVEPHRKPQKRSEVNRRIFDLLLCRVPLRKIARHLNISTRTVYLKIDFLHQQCLKFAAYHESKLINGKVDLPSKIHLSTDRQVLISNWKRHEDKRCVEIYGIGTACQKTGYVFGYHLNYDDAIPQAKLEKIAKESNDIAKPKHHRKTARAWTNSDFEESINQSAARKKKKIQLSESMSEVIDADTSEYLNDSNQLPEDGVLVHNEYTMMGHFLFLKHLLVNIPSKFFHIDLDTGMKSALISIFAPEIKNGQCHGTLISSEKNQTQPQRMEAVAKTSKLIKEKCGKERKLLSGLEYYEVTTEILQEQLIGVLDTDWFQHPIAKLSEPKKKITAITGLSHLDPQERADAYWRASLHPIDRFFMQIRRSINIFERSLATGTKDAAWNIYSPYNPSIFQKLGDIYRVFYNYCEKNGKKGTPAMKLGLVQDVIELERIIKH